MAYADPDRRPDVTPGTGRDLAAYPLLDPRDLLAAGDPSPAAPVLPAVRRLQPLRPVALAHPVLPDPGRGAGVGLARGRAVADRLRVRHEPDRGRLLGPRLPGRTRQATGRPGLGRCHPPRPAHGVAALPVDLAWHRHRSSGAHERAARGTAGFGW